MRSRLRLPLPVAPALFSLLFFFTLSAAEPPRVSAGKLPAWFPAGLFTPDNVEAEDYGENEFFVSRPGSRSGDYDKVSVRGRHWQANLPPKERERWREQGLARWRKEAEPQLEAAGFRNVYRHGDEYNVEMTYKKGQGEGATYLRVTLDARDTSRNKMRAIQVASNPLVVDLKPPSPTAETVTDTSDFPYLTPPEHAKLSRTVHHDEPMHFFEAQTGPDTLVASGSVSKDYEDNSTISQLAFHDAYVAALKKAGWTVTRDIGEQGFLYARYDRNGREIYVYLTHVQGRPFTFNVADVGSGLKAALAKDCKAALYGVNFDFDKATLRPDSEPVLQQIVGLMKDEPKLALEIGGHTDNVGKPDYNMGLSDRRAAAVRQWLVAHGVAAARLTSRGYGDTQPLVPNTSDDNRAKNRRVELKKAGCK